MSLWSNFRDEMDRALCSLFYVPIPATEVRRARGSALIAAALIETDEATTVTTADGFMDYILHGKPPL